MVVDSARSKPRLGILGGSGPEAGADLLSKVLRAHRSQLGDAYLTDTDGPDIMLVSASAIGGPHSPERDLTPGTPGYDVLWRALSEHITEMAPRVDRFAVCCNQLHAFEPQIRSHLLSIGEDSEKFVSMITVTTEYCHKTLVEGRTPWARRQDALPSSVAILGGPATTDLDGHSPYANCNINEAIYIFD